MSPIDVSQLPAKVHLSGADCFHLVLDKHSQKHQAGGNTMHQVFCFDQALEEEKLLQTLHRSALLYWLCNIELVYGSLWRIPYWKFSDTGRTVLLFNMNHAIEDEIPPSIGQLDIPLHAERFIVFNSIRYPSGKYTLVMSWNHILMDGKGTSLLIRHLSDLFQGKENAYTNFFPAREKRPNIIGYIRNMYKVKAFVKKSSAAPIASIAQSEIPAKEGFQVQTLFFNSAETKQIDKNAFDHGARFGANLYYLSCCLHAVQHHLAKQGRSGALWTPIPYDGRLRGAAGPIISNNVSFVFYRVEKDQMASVSKTIAHLSSQMAHQLKMDMPKRYARFLNMMRHIPLSLYYLMIKSAGKGSFSSFLYSSTANNYNDLHHLFGADVQQIMVYPCPTYPPGLTFIFNRHADAVNISFAWMPADLDKTAISGLIEDIRHLLLHGE